MSWEVIILTEGSEQIGFGHIYRCLALAGELEKRKINVRLIISGSPFIEAFKAYENITYVDWTNSGHLNTILAETPDAIFVDSYKATETTFNQLSEGEHQLFIIDDNNDFRYSRGTIINPSVIANTLEYPLEDPNFVYLLGSEYTIIRGAFTEQVERTYKKKVTDVLVMIGGTDILGIGDQIVKTVVERYPTIIVHLISRSTLYSENEQIKIYQNLDEHRLKELMLKVDFAVIGGGQTIFELIATRTPFIAIKVAENQANNIKMLSEGNLGLTMESSEDLLPYLDSIMGITTREKIIHEQNKYDFNGPKNIVNYFLLNSINIEPMKLSDSKEIYTLSSSPEVRQWSKNKASFSFESHKKWLEKQLTEENYFILRKKKSHLFLGQIRFSKETNYDYLVSLSFSKELRGKGIGHLLLRKAISQMKKTESEFKILAEILPENKASVRIFEKAGFTFVKGTDGILMYEFISK